jgi:hypothetical protein
MKYEILTAYQLSVKFTDIKFEQNLSNISAENIRSWIEGQMDGYDPT